jgi:hypothetical protein
MTTRQRSILAGALITGILSTSYFNFINTMCCLGVMLGGAVTVQQFTSQSGTALEAGDGAVLGALTGAAGAVLAAIFEGVLRPVGLDSDTISRDLMEEWSRSMEGEQMMSPEMMEQLQTGETSIMFIIFGTAVTMVIYAVFGAIGGAVGTSLFGPEDA